MDRSYYLNKINKLFKINPMVSLLGPRQVGKTTLARQFARQQQDLGCPVSFFDLENPFDFQRLEDYSLTLGSLEGLLVLDEVQQMPQLFPYLRYLVDQKSTVLKILLLGSASPHIIQKASESLAGRLSLIQLPPFSLLEVDDRESLWFRGGYPKAYLSDSDEDAQLWLKDYIRLFLERDIPALGFNLPLQTLRRFWYMLAHYHGNILNLSEMGRSLGVSDTTVRRYLEILEGTFVVKSLYPWFENIKKRQVKSPKIYFQDTGLLHVLLSIFHRKDLMHHPKVGASWEGFAMESVMQKLRVDPGTCYFWSSHTEAEVDLVIVTGHRKQGFEFKFSSAPKLTKSMIHGFQDLGLDHLTVLYPGQDSYLLKKNIQCMGLESFLKQGVE